MPNALFVWVPKTGGLSIYDALKPYGAHKCLQTSRVIGFNFQGIVTFGHMDVAALESHGYLRGAFGHRAYRFAFVRNPYDRAVSLWAYSRQKGTIAHDCEFLDFCRLLACGVPPIGLYNKDGLSQCSPQVRWTERARLSFVGSFETLQDDFDFLCSEIGVKPRKLPHRNRSPHRDWRGYVHGEAREILADFYREDFEEFGYTKGVTHAT